MTKSTAWSASAQTGQSLPAANLHELLDSARNAKDVGAQQFLTPIELAAAVAQPLPRWRGLGADLQCGTGNLLAGAKCSRVLGCDIDPVAIKAINSKDILCADLTQLYPLLAESNCRFDLLTLNPPFSLQWDTDRLRDLAQSEARAVAEIFRSVQGRDTIDSTLATLLIGIDRLTMRGEGLFLCNQSAAVRILGEFDAENLKPETLKPAATDALQRPGFQNFPLRKHIWAWLHVPACRLFQNATVDLAVLWFTGDQYSTRGPVCFDSPSDLASIAATCRVIATQRPTLRRGLAVGSDYDADGDTLNRWRIASAEYRQRQQSAVPAHNIWLDKDGKVGVYLTPFQEISTKLPQADVKSLWAMRGQFPQSLVVQKETRNALSRAVRGGIWTVHPDLLPAVDDALRGYDAIRAPFYALNEVQRLGFLDEEDSIICKRDYLGVFVAGRRYQLSTATRTLSRTEERLNLVGEFDRVQISGCEMLITITDETGMRHNFVPDPTAEILDERRRKLYPGDRLGARSKIENSQDLAALVEHFVIPEVPDLAVVYPDRYAEALSVLHEIESEINEKAKG